MAPKNGPLSTVTTGKSENPPDGLPVITPGPDNDEWLSSMRREDEASDGNAEDADSDKAAS